MARQIIRSRFGKRLIAGRRSSARGWAAALASLSLAAAAGCSRGSASDQGDEAKTTVVAEVTDASEALRAIADSDADVAVVEIQLPVDEGLAIIATLRAVHPTLVIVVCTFHHDAATQRQAAEAGADDYLVKPVSARQLRATLTRRSLKPSANMIA